ncbi:MAG: type II secretion system protein [Patescibacteria group bacterium]
MVSPLFRFAQKKNKKGFTLIELLVVMSIIAMLSSVILVSLRRARDKSLDAKVKQQLRNFRTAAELYKDVVGNGTYGGGQVMAEDGNDAGITIANGCAGGMFGHSSIAPYFLKSNYPAYVTDAITSPPDTNYASCIAIRFPDEDGNISTGNATRYMVTVRLSDNSYYCVDSLGNSLTRLTNPVRTRSTINVLGAFFTLEDCNSVLNCN